MDIAVLILVILNLLWNLLRTYYTSYIKEAAKSDVTKRDIEEITSKVESIKVEFIKETEKLKQELQFVNQAKVTFQNDLKTVVVQTYEAAEACVNLIYDHFVDSYALGYSLEDIKNAEGSMNKAYASFFSMRGKFKLYVPNKQYTDLIKDLNLALIDYHSYVEEYFTGLEEILEREQALLLDEPDLEEPLGEEKKELYERWLPEQHTFYGKVTDLKDKFKDTCYALLTTPFMK